MTEPIRRSITVRCTPAQAFRVFTEVQATGSEASGEVLAWDPPARLAMAWEPNATPLPPTEVEINFEAVEGGTQVELEHRGWERLGDDAVEAKESYATGWPMVFDRLFGEAAYRAA